MAHILALDNTTIDKIAAGEVVEKPSSVVKELVENAMDAGATAITVEIKNGGCDFIRVTDNGCGIVKNEIPLAFLRHATSKISTVEDLLYLNTLGFRGEALASIAAVAQVEMISKTEEELTGLLFRVDGGEVVEQKEVGAPVGTTLIVRNLFFNTPARKKFLKAPTTEGAYIVELMQHMALSKPDLSIKMVVNNLTRFHTSGNGDLKEVIYRIYGRDLAANLVPVSYCDNGVTVEGYLGKPEISRANRNYENYFVNHRYVKSELVSLGIEEAYANFMMQHRFPFCALHICVDSTQLDVNVHPTKMEVRFSNQEEFRIMLTNAVRDSLNETERIPNVALEEIKEEPPVVMQSTPEPFEKNRIENSADEILNENHIEQNLLKENPIANKILSNDLWKSNNNTEDIHANIIKQKDSIIVEKVEQMNMFEEKMLTKENVKNYHILGQLFQTYWLIEFEDKLFILDQHAAHEKVKYEEFMKRLQNHAIVSQNLSPAIVIEMQPIEIEVYEKYEDVFIQLGYEIEEFGGNEFVIRSVPLDLYGCNEKELFTQVIDELCNDADSHSEPEAVKAKIASMACKAAVKGNHTMSREEIEVLLDKMLELDNPYNCPHGRPTMISMSKYEIEKKFKRIV